MSKAGLDTRKQDGEIGHKHGATPIGTLRKITGKVLPPVIPQPTG